MKLKAGETFYIVSDADGKKYLRDNWGDAPPFSTLCTTSASDGDPILTKELEGDWLTQEEINEAIVDWKNKTRTKPEPHCCYCNVVYHLDDNYCAGCGAPL
jgi:hypothetical protein